MQARDGATSARSPSRKKVAHAPGGCAIPASRQLPSRASPCIDRHRLKARAEQALRGVKCALMGDASANEQDAGSRWRQHLLEGLLRTAAVLMTVALPVLLIQTRSYRLDWVSPI